MKVNTLCFHVFITDVTGEYKDEHASLPEFAAGNDDQRCGFIKEK